MNRYPNTYSRVMIRHCKIALYGLLAVLTAPSCSITGPSPLKQMTRRHSRVVWVQDQGHGANTFAKGHTLKLMGLDSENRRGERVIIGEPGNYYKPLFTPDGTHIVYTDFAKQEVFIVNWKGSDIKKLGSGTAIEVWRDPETRIVWVYVLDGPEQSTKYLTPNPLYRFPLDRTEQRELVWNKTSMSWNNFQLSADGKRAGGLFPWPHAGILNTETGAWTKKGRGCWTSFSPDNQYLLWVFDGAHRNITFFQEHMDKSWNVNINGAPGIEGYEVYHPRWSNHPRFFTMTGPYVEGEGGNKIGGGGRRVEIYVGQFNRTFTDVEQWVHVSHNEKGDFYPDLWVAGIDQRHHSPTNAPPDSSRTEKYDTWPGPRDHLVFIWENLKAPNQLSTNSPMGYDSCNVTARGRARYGRYFEMNTRDGFFEAEIAPHRLAAAFRESNAFSIEAVCVPDRTNQTGTILSYGQDHSDPNIAIKQQGSNLVLFLKGDTEALHVSRPSGAVNHLIVTCQPNLLRAYINGTPAGQIPTTQNHLDHWGAHPLFFGGLPDGREDWAGSLEGIALYNRAISADEAKRKYALYTKRLGDRKPAEQLIIQAKLLEQSAIPQPDAIGAYNRALAVHTYEIAEVLSGTYTEQYISIAQWAILDRTVVADVEPIGSLYRFTVEKFDDHPELEGERLLTDIFEPELTLYYEVDRVKQDTGANVRVDM